MKNIIISPSGITNIAIGDTVTFSIESPPFDYFNTSIEWYLDGVVVSTSKSCTLNFEQLSTPELYVTTKEYSISSWTGGNFYGGQFIGKFGGGVFNYGKLNGLNYSNESIKPKPFIQ